MRLLHRLTVSTERTVHSGRPVRPSIVVTEKGARPQQRHADLPTDDSYAVILAIDPRRVHFTGQPDAVLERAGDVVVFDARLCHGGAGREHGGTRGASGAGPPDKRHVFGAHVYAGTSMRALPEDGPRPHPPHRMQPSERRPGRRLGQGRRARQSTWRGEDRGPSRARSPGHVSGSSLSGRGRTARSCASTARTPTRTTSPPDLGSPLGPPTPTWPLAPDAATGKGPPRHANRPAATEEATGGRPWGDGTESRGAGKEGGLPRLV